MTVPALARIVRDLRTQLAELEYAPLVIFWNAPQLTRSDILHRMSVPCWEDACQDCPGCVCACHAEPLPALDRYDGPGRLETVTAEYYGRRP